MARTPTVFWKDDAVHLIDQTRLPLETRIRVCRRVSDVVDAIRRLCVRGAPAIGVAAGFGAALGARQFRGRDRKAFDRHVRQVCRGLAASRPTAVNLFHVLKQIEDLVDEDTDSSVEVMKEKILSRAQAFFEEDKAVCRAMGRAGAALIHDGDHCLTICNAGALATVDYGTALGVFYAAQEAGKTFHVFACETRPLLQGARLTAWELHRARIPTTVICDNMAGALMKRRSIQAVFVGADRIAANGDTANKIGTYGLAVLARAHRVPFYVVAPLSTFDLSLSSGESIPIEERALNEVKSFAGRPIVPPGVSVWNPAFDVTPARLISGIITERGLLSPPFRSACRRWRKEGVFAQSLAHHDRAR